MGTMRVAKLTHGTSIGRCEEIRRAGIHRCITQRCPHPGRFDVVTGISHGYAPIVMPRNTPAAFVDFNATPTGPSSTSPVFTAPGVVKSGAK